MQQQLMQPFEITLDDLDQAGGAGDMHELTTTVSTGLVVGAATATAPIIAGTLAAAAVVTAAAAVYYAVTEDE